MIYQERFGYIIHEILDMRKLSAKWVQRKLSAKWVQRNINAAKKHD
jgi:hypothetical protein